jgi:hypothetical protein
MRKLFTALAALALVAGGGTAASASPEVPAVSYSVCNYNYGGCVLATGSGNQMQVSDSADSLYTEVSPVECGGDTTTCHEFKDTTTGLCWKYDPNISGKPMVELACTTSGTTGEEEEMSVTSVTDGVAISPEWTFDNEATDSIMCDYEDDQLVSVCSQDGSGKTWVLDS